VQASAHFDNPLQRLPTLVALPPPTEPLQKLYATQIDALYKAIACPTAEAAFSAAGCSSDGGGSIVLAAIKHAQQQQQQQQQQLLFPTSAGGGGDLATPLLPYVQVVEAAVAAHTASVDRRADAVHKQHLAAIAAAKKAARAASAASASAATASAAASSASAEGGSSAGVSSAAATAAASAAAGKKPRGEKRKSGGANVTFSSAVAPPPAASAAPASAPGAGGPTAAAGASSSASAAGGASAGASGSARVQAWGGNGTEGGSGGGGGSSGCGGGLKETLSPSKSALVRNFVLPANLYPGTEMFAQNPTLARALQAASQNVAASPIPGETEVATAARVLEVYKDLVAYLLSKTEQGKDFIQKNSHPS